jgi:hypothetical protein
LTLRDGRTCDEVVVGAAGVFTVNTIAGLSSETFSA